MKQSEIKMVGASAEELADPRVQEMLAGQESMGAPAAAKILTAANPPPPADMVPLASEQHGLEKYGIKLRRKTNIHDLFIQRIVGFGVPPTRAWIAEFERDSKTKGQPAPVKIIPAMYMTSIFIFILAAPFAVIECAFTVAEADGGPEAFYQFMESVDAWTANCGIPTDKTKEVWDSIIKSLSILEGFGGSTETAAPTDGPGVGVTVKKSKRPGSSRITG